MAVLIDALYILCCGGLGVLSIFVLHQRKLDRLNRAFLALSMALLAWVGSLYFFDRTSDPSTLLTLGRINFAAAAVMALCGFLFAAAVASQPHDGQARVHQPDCDTSGRASTPRSLAIYGETTILCLLTLATPAVDRSESVEAGQHVTVFGPLFLVYAAHLACYGVAALCVAFRPARAVAPRVRRHLRIVGIGILTTAFVATVCDIVLPYWFHAFAFQELGALSVLGFVAAVGYAILVHHLFDIRVIIRRTVVFAALLGFVTTVYGLLVFGVSILVQRGVGVSARCSSLTCPDLSRSLYVANFAALAITGFSFAPLRRWLEDLTDRFLFHKEYDVQLVTAKITRLLNDVIELDEALQIVMTTLVEALKVSHAVTYLFQPSERGEVAIKRIRQLGYPPTKNLALNAGDGVIAYFQQHPSIVATATLTKSVEGGQPSAPASTATVHKRLRALGSEIAIPLSVGEKPESRNAPSSSSGQLVGLILLSAKKSGATFSTEDRELLGAVGTSAVSAIQKAKLYDADKLKSEFVSIASHELLTPISAIQGYLSMILEGSSNIDDQTRSYLTKVFASAQRLAQLVKDLLSVSRIESGKIEIKARMLDLGPLIADAVDQLQVKAREKNLTLSFVAINEPLPPVWADSDRVTQVLVNLIGNAVKYTRTGSVKVTAVAVSKPIPIVKIAVIDTGLGISEKDRTHLFEKFYRAQGAATTATGTGLGLYITKTIVEKMAGEITVESVVGKGSVFSFTLPQFQVEHAAIYP